jgi:hypothetical protein
VKYERHDKLDELKRTADNNNEPWNILGFDVSNEMNPKAKGNRKKGIIEDTLETVLWQVVEARTEVKGDKVKAEAKVWVGKINNKWKDSYTDCADKVYPKNSRGNDVKNTFSLQVQNNQN